MAKNIGTHVTHCCEQHGCKYGDTDCPVTQKEAEQEYACEDCTSVEELETELGYIQEELAWTQKLEARGIRVR